MTRKEAIEIVRNIYQTDAEKEALGTLIPELRESEDERIRQFLLRLAKRCSENSIDFMDEIKKGDVIAYLERQKEQKEIPLMGGDTDTYFDDLRITTKPLTSREWFDEGIKYAQRLQKEQKPAEWSEELKNELAKKHLDGYTMGREDAMREMSDFLKSHFNSEEAKWYNPPAINIPTWTPPCYNGWPCANPQKDCINCPRANVVISPNTASGTSTATLHGNTSTTDGKEHNPSFTD